MAGFQMESHFFITEGEGSREKMLWSVWWGWPAPPHTKALPRSRIYIAGNQNQHGLAKRMQYVPVINIIR